ncbi:haloalkane dehalogenase [Mesorhizobium sp. B2-1-8]|uniref:haloalkane dehalogenase n=1 Tax=Mesorhizobium sp. B2-1-8 TaxID=2589967 RepID=UPI00112B6640|nr:haloalkane dehalogenase [Mesorhizobium sp. B2-1-8]UCI19935.1 haloalkane dehalogenase [Mesorhizobium sp. B2-1-8]
MTGTKPYEALKYREINGTRMAYVDEGAGDAIVFQHGQPTSSYVWRNVMPHLEGLGRLVACDLIGMGASDKLVNTGPGSYSVAEHAEYLFALWDSLELGNRIVLVLDDWGAALGFLWARLNPGRVLAIVHMEAVALPMSFADLPEQAHPFFKALRSPAGEEMVLQQNVFIEQVLLRATIRDLTPEEMEHYRRPFLEPGEGRRPTLSFPRNLPLDGEPVGTANAISASAEWMARSRHLPKLFIRGEPGTLMRGRVLDEVRGWPNQTEVTVKGIKLLQEDSADEIGRAIAAFVTDVRQAS